MSRKFLTAIDLSKNEIQNAVVQVLASAPSNPSVGQIYYNSTSGRFEFRGATAWIDPTSRSSHTGTQTASTIADFSTAVQATRLDQLTAPTASVALNSQRITGLATPTSDTDAATKGYVDAAVNGTDWKQSVRVGTTANIASLSGLLVIDGVTLLVNDRVLVKDQSVGSANGIYVVSAGSWTRSTDADTNSKVTAGMSVMITEGTTLADSQWRLTTNDTIVLGTTPLSFSQIGAGTSYTAGTGIDINGSVISINTSTVPRKYVVNIGNGSATSIAVSHGLSTLDVQVQVYDVATGDTVECDVTRNSTSQVTFGFTTAPASNSLRVVVIG